MRVLSYHIGIENAIQKADLINECAKLGATFKDERQARLVVVKLRKSGVPVGSSSGESGYFLPANLAEYSEFRGREYVKKIVDMRETVTAMDASAKAMFPTEYADFKRQQAAAAGQPQLL